VVSSEKFSIPPNVGPKLCQHKKYLVNVTTILLSDMHRISFRPLYTHIRNYIRGRSPQDSCQITKNLALWLGNIEIS